MLLIDKIVEIRNFVNEAASNKRSIALVPTMGAIHQGHLSLIKAAKKAADIVVVSIFVNKAQFNQDKDFNSYPRDLKSDITKLENLGVDVIFAPNHQEIYSSPAAVNINISQLSDSLCGNSRKGHFDGVCLIITKLFNILRPDFAIFGEKDFQQLQIIRKLVSDLNFTTKVISHPTCRLDNGLAMSSRNELLSDLEQQQASNIYKILQRAKDEINHNPHQLDNILQQLRSEITKCGFDRIDYFELRQEHDLKLVTNFDVNIKSRIFFAGFFKGVRLIDNLAC